MDEAWQMLTKMSKNRIVLASRSESRHRSQQVRLRTVNGTSMEEVRIQPHAANHPA
jgi:hypothetical protein